MWNPVSSLDIYCPFWLCSSFQAVVNARACRFSCWVWIFNCVVVIWFVCGNIYLNFMKHFSALTPSKVNSNVTTYKSARTSGIEDICVTLVLINVTSATTSKDLWDVSILPYFACISYMNIVLKCSYGTYIILGVTVLGILVPSLIPHKKVSDAFMILDVCLFSYFFWTFFAVCSPLVLVYHLTCVSQSTGYLLFF